MTSASAAVSAAKRAAMPVSNGLSLKNGQKRDAAPGGCRNPSAHFLTFIVPDFQIVGHNRAPNLSPRRSRSFSAAHFLPGRRPLSHLCPPSSSPDSAQSLTHPAQSLTFLPLTVRNGVLNLG